MKIDHTTIHKTESQFITTDRETTLNHHKGVTHVIIFQNNIKVVVHLNIKEKSIK